MRKNKHKRSHSYGATLERLFKPSTSLDKSKSTNSSFEKGFEKERGEQQLLKIPSSSALLPPLTSTLLPLLHSENTLKTPGQHHDNTLATPGQHHDNPLKASGQHHDNTLATPERHHDSELTTDGAGSSFLSSKTLSTKAMLSTQRTTVKSVSPKAESTSNVSDHVQEHLDKLKEDYNSLSAEYEALKENQKEQIERLNDELQRFYTHLEVIESRIDEQFRSLMDRVDYKLDNITYSSEERMKDIEDRLDRHRIKMTQFEQIQEQKKNEGPLSTNDLANRGRDLLSSVISLGLAIVSFILFVVTVIVDFVKLFTENNILSTTLALGLFGAVIASYYYFIEVEKSSVGS